MYVLVAGVYVRVGTGGEGGGGTHQAQGAGVPSTLNPSNSPAVMSWAGYQTDSLGLNTKLFLGKLAIWKMIKAQKRTLSSIYYNVTLI